MKQLQHETWTTFWKIGFRLGLIGFLLIISLQAQADDQQQPATGEKEWQILITPGVASEKQPDQLVTFRLDEKTGKVLGEPLVENLGPDHGKLVGEIEIIPAEGQPATIIAADAADGDLHDLTAVPPAPCCGPVIGSKRYQAIYDSIPFSRAEYLANPAYRHEATMEILFGKMRPTVIHKNQNPKVIDNQLRWVPRYPLPLGGYFGSYIHYPYYLSNYPYITPDSTNRRYQPLPGPLYYRYSSRSLLRYRLPLPW